MNARRREPGGERPPRRDREERAAYHEVAGFPASVARLDIEIAVELIRAHIIQRGATILLLDALEWLSRARVFIEEWREADAERCGYPYRWGSRGDAEEAESKYEDGFRPGTPE